MHNQQVAILPLIVELLQLADRGSDDSICARSATDSSQSRTLIRVARDVSHTCIMKFALISIHLRNSDRGTSRRIQRGMRRLEISELAHRSGHRRTPPSASAAAFAASGPCPSPSTTIADSLWSMSRNCHASPHSVSFGAGTLIAENSDKAGAFTVDAQTREHHYGACGLRRVDIKFS